MTEWLPRPWTGGSPPNLRTHPYNRVRACLPFEEDEPLVWQIGWTVSPSEDAPEPDYIAELHRRLKSRRALTGLDAALRAVHALDVAHSRDYNAHHIEQRLSEVQQTLEERLSDLVDARVDALFAERERAKRDAENRVNDLLQKLRAKAKGTEKPVSLEEAWAMVDLSAFGDDDAE